MKSGNTIRVRQIALVNLTIILLSVTLKDRTIMPKIFLVSDHYARVILAEISLMNLWYHRTPTGITTQMSHVVIVVRMTAEPDGPGNAGILLLPSL